MQTDKLKIMVPKGWNFTVEVKPDGSCMLTLAPATAEAAPIHHQEDIPKMFVPASKLSLEDYFLKYTPKTSKEKNFMEAVVKVIKAGVKDFFRPILDPSFDRDGQICYQAGMKPAVGESANWWAEHAKKLGYRLGTYSEYIAFLAVLIKELVASGKSLEWAWNAVCNDSKELGHYWDSSDAKYRIETTGNREICGCYDLGNTGKILAEDEETGGCWLAGGYYGNLGHILPLAHLCHSDCCGEGFSSSTGWLVASSF